MKRILLILLLTFACTSQAFAWDNLCSNAGPFVNAPTTKIADFASNNTMRNYEGSGRVRDILNGTLTSKFRVIVDCGNNVLVTVPTSSSRASNDLKIGDSVSFSGPLTGVDRKRYADNQKWFLMAYLNDDSTVK
jgi:hypothetical protein